MESKITTFTSEQYHTLYLQAFARLEDISRQTEQAMQELEELQLQMGDEQFPCEQPLVFAPRQQPQKKIS